MPKTTQAKANPIAAAELGASRALSRLGRLQVNVEKKAANRANKIKFLLGAGLEVMIRRDPALRARVKSFMTGFLTRKNDLAAFALGAADDYFEHLDSDDAEAEAALSILRDPEVSIPAPGAAKDAARPVRTSVLGAAPSTSPSSAAPRVSGNGVASPTHSS